MAPRLGLIDSNPHTGLPCTCLLPLADTAGRLLVRLPLLVLSERLVCGWANKMHRHSDPRSTLHRTDLQASYLPCIHSIALMLVRLLVVLVVVMLMVTQEQVDTPSDHGALVCSHALPILERSLVMCHHSPPRRCNRGFVRSF